MHKQILRVYVWFLFLIIVYMWFYISIFMMIQNISLSHYIGMGNISIRVLTVAH